MTENWTEIAFAQKHGTSAYIAAASPEVVLGLLDSIEVLEGRYATASGQRNTAEAERDQLRAVAVRMKEALEMLAAQTSGIPGSTARADCMASIASIALTDPEVEKL
jgi:hypothetical protein